MYIHTQLSPSIKNSKNEKSRRETLRFQGQLSIVGERIGDFFFFPHSSLLCIFQIVTVSGILSQDGKIRLLSSPLFKCSVETR